MGSRSPRRPQERQQEGQVHVPEICSSGNACDASGFYRLKENNIEAIINATKEIPNYFEDDFDYLKINIYDINSNQFNSETFKNVLNFIEKNKNKKILIHCYMGSSRSATLVLLYLMYKHKYDLESALEFIKNKRDIINVNTQFISNLTQFIKNNI